MSPAFDNVSIIDVAGLLLVLAIGVAGAIKGAARYVIGLVTLLVGVGLATRFGASLGAASWPLVDSAEDPEKIGALVGGGLIFVGVLLVGGLVAKLLRAALESASLGGFDRFIGFVLGAARGLVFTMVAVIVIKAVNVEGMREDLAGSYALEVTQKIASATRPHLPAETGDLIARTLELEEPAAPR